MFLLLFAFASCESPIIPQLPRLTFEQHYDEINEAFYDVGYDNELKTHCQPSFVLGLDLKPVKCLPYPGNVLYSDSKCDNGVLLHYTLLPGESYLTDRKKQTYKIETSKKDIEAFRLDSRDECVPAVKVSAREVLKVDYSTFADYPN